MVDIENSKNHRIGVIQLITAMCISGTIGMLVTESGQDPSNIVLFRCVFGSMSLGLLCWIKKAFVFDKLDYKNFGLILLGGVCLVFNWLYLFKAYQEISLSLGTVVYHAKPFVILIVGSIIFREKLILDQILWVCLAFLGMLVITQINIFDLDITDHKLVGVGYAFLASMLYSISTLIVKKIKTIPAVFIAFLQVNLGIVLLYPLANLESVLHLGHHWFYLVSLGVVHTGIMYSLNYASYQKLTSVAIAILSFIYPVVTIITDYLFYGFLFNSIQFIGVLIIVLATLGVNFQWRFFFMNFSFIRKILSR